MKKTPWFNSIKYHPKRIGVYEVESLYDNCTWSFWDGIGWNGCWDSEIYAEENKDYAKEQNGWRGLRVIQWRGLAKKP